MEHTETDSVVGHIIVGSTAEVLADQGPIKAVEQLHDLVSEEIIDTDDVENFARAAGAAAISEGLGDRELRRDIILHQRERQIRQQRARTNASRIIARR